MEEIIQGKHFSITDPEGVKTVIYQVNKTEKEFLKDYPKIQLVFLVYLLYFYTILLLAL